jgi:hypothetical protein
MGMNAEILAIGSIQILAFYDVLMYPVEYYSEYPKETIVIGSIAGSETSEGSRRLAELCGAEPWNFVTHRLSLSQLPTVEQLGGASQMMDSDPIGCQDEWTIYNCIEGLLRDGVTLWYMPNG